MSRDDAYLYDILESSRAALEYMQGKTWDEFSKDPMLQDAVVRRLEIIAEFHLQRKRNTLIFRGKP